MLNSAEHKIFSANKYENANYSYLLAEKISCSAMFSKKKKNMELSVVWDL